MLVGIAFLIGSSYSIYSMFGTFRRDPVYIEKIVQAYENPEDSVLLNAYKIYDDSVRTKKTEAEPVE